MADLSDDSQQPVCPGCQERDRRIAQLEARVQKLEEQLTQALRAGKRQAAPFSKGPPQSEPRPPGRKSGADYGPKARRLPPPRIDESYLAPLPSACPHCGGAVLLDRVEEQYQTEILCRPLYRRFEVQVGFCQDCQRRLQGRHDLQSSQALGAAASGLGAHLQALLVQANKQLGLSYGKVLRLLEHLSQGQIPLSPGGACQAVQRLGRRCQASARQVVQRLADQAAVAVDSTGWKIGGRNATLHAAASADLVAYHLERGADAQAVQKLVSLEYTGVLEHDGAAVYDWFWQADHQTCLAHLLRRCRRLGETLPAGAQGLSRGVKEILQRALALRDERESGRRSVRATRMWAGLLEGKLMALCRRPWKHRENRRLAKHLQKHRDQLFTFLKRTGVQATSYRAEQAIRPAVVNRKVWGGNRTEAGAQTQAVLMTVLGTAQRRVVDAGRFLVRVVRSLPGKEPLLLDST